MTKYLENLLRHTISQIKIDRTKTPEMVAYQLKHIGDLYDVVRKDNRKTNYKGL